MQHNTMHSNAMQCYAMLCNTKQYNGMQWHPIQRNSTQHNVIRNTSSWLRNSSQTTNEIWHGLIRNRKPWIVFYAEYNLVHLPLQWQTDRPEIRKLFQRVAWSSRCLTFSVLAINGSATRIDWENKNGRWRNIRHYYFDGDAVMSWIVCFVHISMEHIFVVCCQRLE